MGHTIAEKILARCAGRPHVSPGEYVWAGVDQTDADANYLRILDEMGVKQLAAPDKVWATSDHYAPATDQHYANQDNLLRKYVRQYGIKNFFEYGRHGIMWWAAAFRARAVSSSRWTNRNVPTV